MTSRELTSVRLASLDQFRGYTVIAMFVVNFLGGFAVTPGILKHHNDYCSFADTIMPQFLFAVGFAFRLTFEARVQRDGQRLARRRVFTRLLGLALLSVVVYSVGNVTDDWDTFLAMGPASVLGRVCKRTWFQTLMHIAATSLWILPVIRLSARGRIAFAVFSASLHVLLSWWFNFEWCNTSPNAIDGGPLGFLAWSIPAMTGTLACDLLQTPDIPERWIRLTSGSASLLLVGWLLSCGTRFYDAPPESASNLPEQRLAANPVFPSGNRLGFLGFAEPPFVPPPPPTERKWNYWMMSQRAATLSYVTFAAGVSLLLFAGFHLISDICRRELVVFKVFGTNALAGYVLHLMLMDAIHPFVPRNAPGWYVMSALCVFLLIMWVFVRHFDRHKIYIRL